MKQEYYPFAVASMSSAVLGIICTSLLLIGPIEWINTVVIVLMVFFVLAILTGAYSLYVKRNNLAWAGMVVGLIFFVAFIAIGLLLRDMCVIC